jgi:glycine/D-amino acid oxidase-like deaminating enzyme
MKTTAPHLLGLMKLITDKEELAKYRIESADGAVVTSIAARLWPYKLVSHLLTDLLMSSDLRGTFNLQTLTPVTKLEPASDGRWTVNTARGSILAKRVILATNAYTSHLLPSFADLIVPCRGQMSALKPLPSLSGSNRLKTSMGFEGDGMDDYLIQRPSERGGHLMFGGGRTSAPSLGVTDDSVVDPETAAYLHRQLVGVFKLPEGSSGSTDKDKPVEFEATHEWTGIMGFSRDEVPWVGPVSSKPGVFIAAGFTGHGMPNTWLSGKAVAMMARSSLQGEGMQSVEQARMETGLPRAYLLTDERIERCMERMDIEVLEQAGMERAQKVKAVAEP